MGEASSTDKLAYVLYNVCLSVFSVSDRLDVFIPVAARMKVVGATVKSMAATARQCE